MEQSNTNTILFLVVAAVAGYFLFGSLGGDDLSRVRAAGEKVYRVDYTSPDEEFIISEDVAAKTEKQAISRLKAHYKEKGEVLRGGRWDAEIWD